MQEVKLLQSIYQALYKGKQQGTSIAVSTKTHSELDRIDVKVTWWKDGKEIHKDGSFLLSQDAKEIREIITGWYVEHVYFA